MKLMDPEWMSEMRIAFEQGKKAESILDNPYWKTYPKPASTEEESRGRNWVEGYLERMRYAATV